MYINVSTWKESPNSLPEHSQEQVPVKKFSLYEVSSVFK